MVLEPLHPKVWRRSLQGIATSLTIREGVDEFSRLRRLYHLLALTPPPLRRWFAPRLPEELFEQVLRQSLQTAVLSLTGEAFDLSVAPDGNGDGASITMRLGPADLEVETHDSSIARAMVRAICEMGLQLSEP